MNQGPVAAVEERRPMPLESPPPRVIAKPSRVALEDARGSLKTAAPARAVADEAVDTPPEYDGRLITTPDATAELVEQFDRLSEALIRSQTAKNVRTVMISSAQPQEGRSLTAANLALALSQRYGKRVLLVDADPAKPSLHQFFNLRNETGLFDLLRNGYLQAGPLKVTSRLSVVPSGTSDPSEAELLASGDMKAFLQHASATYDWVVLDTAAASALPDAHLLAWLVDGVLMVVKAAQTSQAAVQRAVSEVGGHRVLGLVLNEVSSRAATRTPQAQSLRG
jgi:capsular exopolysaccharide synthesis family protein